MVAISRDRIVLKGVSKKFNDVCAVNNVNLEICENSTLAVFGHSGSGKTTLLRMIAGLETPDSGEIRIRDVITGSSEVNLLPCRLGIGFVFQTPALWPHMTVKQNILFGLAGKSAKESDKRYEELTEALELTGLERRYPGQISGGQAKRVALARTLAPQPEILLMDEPLTNIDSGLKAKILHYLKSEIKEKSKWIVYVTHDEAEGDEIGDRIIRMRGGCIEE